MFKLNSSYKPRGDQPEAINKLVLGLKNGFRRQTLLGVTGSGKTFTMASVISRTQRPAIIISHNKTLVAQLFQEFKNFFPENPVHYFISYYDYYQPEAYLPATDTYIEKDAKINNLIDGLRHAATQSILSQNNFIIISSVSCIYGMGDPAEYESISLDIQKGMRIKRSAILSRLSELQYERSDKETLPGTYKINGDIIEIVLPSAENILRLEFFGDTLEFLKQCPVARKENGMNVSFKAVEKTKLFPAKHFVTPRDKLEAAISRISSELEDRTKELKKTGKIFEAARLKERVNFDIQMLKETGYVTGIENYSRHLSFRNQGDPPFTLLDYLPKETIFFIDESHISIPQIRGMYKGDQARKQALVNYGFRLPSALDNRPLTFKEFNDKAADTIFVSATPGDYELKASEVVTEQLVRPTGLLDPKIEVRPSKGQIQDIIKETKKSVKKRERVLVLALTKRLAEEVSDYLKDKGLKTRYIHSEIKPLDRPKILREFRKGDFDVLVGINLLREGLDLPEVGLVAILDADKEGFLRNDTMFIQTIGRAARHIRGRAILYADIMTGSMKKAIEETRRRRSYQKKYNKKHNITPRPILKEIQSPIFENEVKYSYVNALRENYKNSKELRKRLEEKMYEAAKNFEFKLAAEIRDAILDLDQF